MKSLAVGASKRSKKGQKAAHPGRNRVVSRSFSPHLDPWFHRLPPTHGQKMLGKQGKLHHRAVNEVRTKSSPYVVRISNEFPYDDVGLNVANYLLIVTYVKIAEKGALRELLY